MFTTLRNSKTYIYPFRCPFVPVYSQFTGNTLSNLELDTLERNPLGSERCMWFVFPLLLPCSTLSLVRTIHSKGPGPRFLTQSTLPALWGTPNETQDKTNHFRQGSPAHFKHGSLHRNSCCSPRGYSHFLCGWVCVCALHLLCNANHRCGHQGGHLFPPTTNRLHAR